MLILLGNCISLLDLDDVTSTILKHHGSTRHFDTVVLALQTAHILTARVDGLACTVKLAGNYGIAIKVAVEGTAGSVAPGTGNSVTGSKCGHAGDDGKGDWEELHCG